MHMEPFDPQNPRGPWLPKQSFQPVKLRAITMSCVETGEVGLSFDGPPGTPTLRLRISAEEAWQLHELLGRDYRLVWRMWHQSPMSSGSESGDGSTVPGQSV